MLGLIRKFAQWPWPLVRAVEEQVSDIWAQFRFENNEAINEVNEVPATLIGATTITDGKLVTGNSTATDMQFPVVLFAANEDFTIEGECTINTLNSGGADLLIASWTVSTDPGAHWSVVRIPGTGKWNFWYNGALRLEAATPTGLGKQHVAVTRKDGVMRLYVNGKLEATTTFPAGNTQNVATVPVRMRVNNTTQFINGTRDNLRIAKECLYPVEGFTVSELPAYVRASYSTTLASGILAQYGLRRNSLINEAPAAQTAVLTGAASVTNGRVKTTNVNADQYSFPVEYFGAADFTIEFMFKLSANRNATIQILGQAYAGDRVHQENSWNIYYQNNQLGVAFWPDLQLQYLNVLCGSLTVGVDSHIVVERIGGTITAYVNGAVRGTISFAGPLVVPATHTMTSNNKLPGATGIFGEREIWNIRVANRALYKGEVKTKPTFPAFPILKLIPWMQNTFWNNEVYEEVEGYSYPLVSGISVSDSKLITSSSGTVFQTVARRFVPKENENFTIQLKFNSSVLNNYDILCLALNTVGSTSWRITQTTTGNIEFAFVEAGGTVERSIQTKVIEKDVDHHIAVVRDNGTISIILNGELESSILSTAAFNPVVRDVTTRRTTVQGIVGSRWDIRFDKKALSKYELNAMEITNFFRPYYEETDISKINTQIVVRDNEVRNEVGSSLAGTYSLSSNAIVQALNTSDGQRIQWNAPEFGNADFTIEVEFARSGMGTAAAQLVGDWYITGTSSYNRQNFIGWQLTASSGRIQFYPSPNWAHDPRAITSDPITLVDSVFYHVVVERVDGIISIYLDGVKIASVADAKSITRTGNGKLNIQNFNLDSGWTTSSRLFIRDIRIADKAMYKGDMSLVENHYPRLPGDFSSRIVGLSAQTLIPDTTVIPSTSHNIVGLSAQILVKE